MSYGQTGLTDWLRDLAAEGYDVGERALAAPELPDHLQWVLDAFWDLSRDRPLGFGGVGSIPFTAVDAWARRYGIRSSDQFDRLLFLLRSLDDEYLKIVNKPKGNGGK